jgi:hypothetical protein
MRILLFLIIIHQIYKLYLYITFLLCLFQLITCIFLSMKVFHFASLLISSIYANIVGLYDVSIKIFIRIHYQITNKCTYTIEYKSNNNINMMKLCSLKSGGCGVRVGVRVRGFVLQYILVFSISIHLHLYYFCFGYFYFRHFSFLPFSIIP